MNIVLTFDDGLISHLEFVAPLLQERNFGGTFFISGSLINRTITGLQCLDWDGIKQLNNLGFEIGHHFDHHVDMWYAYQLNAEVKNLDTKLIQNKIPLPVSFCYPCFRCTYEVITHLPKIRPNIQFARGGCKNVRVEDYCHGGSGSAFDPMWDHPMLVHCLGVFGENYQTKELEKDLCKISSGQYGVLCFHGFAERSIDITETEFIKVLDLLSSRNAKVIAMRDITSKSIIRKDDDPQIDGY